MAFLPNPSGLPPMLPPPTLPPGENLVGEGAKPGMDFIIGMLAGAGIPVLSRALRAGRTTGERAANQGPLNPRAIMDQLTPLTAQNQPGIGQPSLVDILPALVARRKGNAGLEMQPDLVPPGLPPIGGL